RSLIKPFGAAFRVTDKTIRRGRLAINRRVAFPFALLLAAHIVGIVFALLVQRQVEEPDAFAIAIYFAGLNIITLWMCVLVSIDVGQQAPFVRFPRNFPCLIAWDGEAVFGETVSVSEGDLVFKPAASISIPPQKLTIHLPTLSIHNAPARAKQIDGNWIVEFVELTLPQRRALIANLFCEPRRWERPPRNEWRAALEFFRAPLRMYPLAESP
ncbi:MAG TPA: hypothetical protein VI282_07165, partial [Verrucomicrobiae bacterium]